MADSQTPESWGRVDETNTVFVVDEGEERQVGQFPDGTADEALAYFVRKFNDLEGQVSLLELRFARGTAGSEVSQSVSHLKALLQRPAAVGNIAALRRRVDELERRTESLLSEQKKEREAAKEQALIARTAVVEEAEALAAQDFADVQWKTVSTRLESLFETWQSLQKNGPHLPKSQADELWRRFRKARQSIDTARRQYFAQLDATNKEVRARKEALIRDAEALAPRGADGVRAYRDLLDKWKRAGHASRKIDDQLWSRFKAAGDVLYAAKHEEDQKQDEEFGKNLEEKRSLLDEAESLLNETNHTVARDALLLLQKRFDAIGKVPRAHTREVETRLRKIEAHVRSLADAHWNATNPETLARAEGLRGQLEGALDQLTAALNQAKSDGNDKQIAQLTEEIETKRAWLAALGDDGSASS